MMRSFGSAGRNGLVHLIQRDRSLRLNEAAERTDGAFRQQNDAAIRMKKKLESISRPNAKPIAHGLGNCRLSLYRYHRFHDAIEGVAATRDRRCGRGRCGRPT